MRSSNVVVSSKLTEDDKEVEWWNQTSCSRNLMDSVGGDDLWDGLFHEKSPNISEHSSSINNGISAQKIGVNCYGDGQSTTKNRNLEEQLGKLSMRATTPVQSSSVSSKNNKPSSHVTENSNVSAIESSNSLGSQAISDMTVHLDYARLKAEHRKLKKYFENAYENRYKTPPITETVRRLNRNEPVPLDFYKSYREKMDLLDATLEHCNWDGVITVLLFIKRTLSNPLFRQCLIERPKAAQHYVTYLRESGDTVELIDTLFGLGQTSEAAMVEFVAACKWKEPKRQLEALRNCLLSGFSHPQLSNERSHLEEWIALLETHLKRP